MMQRRTVPPTLWAMACVLILVVCPGCPQYRDPTVPGEIRRLTEPALGSEYHLYVPTSYDPAKQWALIIVCHGTNPFDHAVRQIRDWAKLAEEEQFIVVAPVLKGTHGVFSPPVATQLARQRRDERSILACAQHVRGAYNVANDRVFLTGWSAGAFAVLHTGMRNPHVFRALAVLQGNFKSEYLTEASRTIDAYQPIYVLFGSNDVLTGKHGHRCVDWLNEHGAAVTQEEVGGTHKNHPKLAYAFFERVVRKASWMHILAVAEDPQDPLTVRFGVRSSFEPQRYEWSFGDGGAGSPVAGPVHTYAQPGDYTVTLGAETPEGKAIRRAVEITVPQDRALPLRLGGGW